MKGNLRSAATVAGLVVFASILAPHSAQAEQHRHTKRLVADYVAGSKFLTPPYGVAQIPFHKLTHIIHASIPWGADGSLSIADGFVEPELIRKAHAAGVKVMLLTGGDFGAIEDNPAVMDTVVANLKDFIVANKYDGLDVDWEFPETDTDFAAFVELMAKLRATPMAFLIAFAFERPWQTMQPPFTPRSGAPRGSRLSSSTSCGRSGRSDALRRPRAFSRPMPSPRRTPTAAS